MKQRMSKGHSSQKKKKKKNSLGIHIVPVAKSIMARNGTAICHLRREEKEQE